MIILKNLCLSYPIGGLNSHSLQVKLLEKLRHQFKKMVGGTLDTAGNGPIVYVHALQNINLVIKEGQRIGIVGHNGAGKTTLLRVLSEVYAPTSGSIHIQGRVNSLTDFTLGMEQEASGIKNIIFRLVFMGYTFKQAKAAVDEIVDFSALGDFIHLPVRTYSTGMFMRLAFSISTHFMPDILILDEIIGAGDESFKLKCRQRLQNLFQQSRVVVLSTHDMASLQEYCDTAIWMEAGKIIAIGTPNDIVTQYTQAKQFREN